MTRHQPFKRADRVGGEMLKALGEMLYDNTLSDPRVQGVTFTGIRLTDDLRYARVFFSHLGSDKDHHLTGKALSHAAAYLRTELARRLKLRYAPELRFEFDPSLERGARIAELLRETQPPPPENNPEQNGSDDD